MNHLPALLSLFSLCAWCAATQAAEPRPNIILAMADDQGYGDMAYMGHPLLKTPVFDEMARSGLRFDHFYAAAPVCSPTRASVMTGRTPNRMGCFKWGYTLRPQEITIAEVLHTAGYATGHFGKWHLGSLRADSPTSPNNSGFDEFLSSPNFFEIDPWMSHNGKAIKTRGEGSEVIVDAALAFIKRAAAKDEPFLAVVWFGSPHSPHIGTEADLALYPDQPKNKRNFLAEITAMDRAMGKLRQGLRKLGMADNTLLWYCSDNGPPFPKVRRADCAARRRTFMKAACACPPSSNGRPESNSRGLQTFLAQRSTSIPRYWNWPAPRSTSNRRWTASASCR